MWRKCTNKHLALLDYRTTPLEGLNMSPAQLLMGRRPRNLLPTSDQMLSPTGHSPSVVESHFDKTKRKQKHYYDRRCGVKHLPQFKSGDFVRLQPQPGT